MPTKWPTSSRCRSPSSWTRRTTGRARASGRASGAGSTPWTTPGTPSGAPPPAWWSTSTATFRRLRGEGALLFALIQAAEVLQRVQVGIDAAHEALGHQRLVRGGLERGELLLVDAEHALQPGRGLVALGHLHGEGREDLEARELSAHLGGAVEVALVLRQQALDALPLRAGLAGGVEQRHAARVEVVLRDADDALAARLAVLVVDLGDAERVAAHEGGQVGAPVPLAGGVDEKVGAVREPEHDHRRVALAGVTRGEHDRVVARRHG